MKKILILLILISSLSALFDKETKKTDQGIVKLIEENKKIRADINILLERYDRLDLRLVGISKHVQAIQDTMKIRNERYNNKMESIDDDSKKVKLNIENLENTVKILQLRMLSIIEE